MIVVVFMCAHSAPQSNKPFLVDSLLLDIESNSLNVKRAKELIMHQMKIQNLNLIERKIVNIMN